MQQALAIDKKAARVTMIVESLLSEPSLNNLSDEQLKTVAKSVLFDSLKDKLKNEVAKAKVDGSVDKLKARWLNKFQSVHTRRSFEKNVAVFLDWFGSRSLLEVDAQVADDFVLYLKNAVTKGSKVRKISDNTILQRIAACSSFFKDLVRWKVVSINPFNGVARPKKLIEIKQSDQIPTDKQLDTIEQIALNAMNGEVANHETNTNRMNKAARMAYVSLKVLRATGLRVGALQGLKIDAGGFYTAKSKGSMVSGRLDDQVLKIIERYGLNRKHPFIGYSGAAFSTWLQRKTDGNYAAHSIRHLFAVKHYSHSKDILATSRALGHKSVLPTQSYLATLRVFE